MRRVFARAASFASIFLIGATLGSAASTTACCPSLTSDVWARDTVAVGLILRSNHFDDLFGAPQYVSVLTVDLSEKEVTVGIEAARRFGEERMTVSAFGEKTKAGAAINGGFAHGGPESANSGIVKVEGEVIPYLREENEELRFVGSSAFGIDASGRWHIRERGGVRWSDDWPEVEQALAVGHALLRDGEVTATIEEERFASGIESAHAGRRHPRTAMCLTTDSTAIFTTVDGRHEGSAEGLTLKELSHLLLSFGCYDALNMDGGGSTTLWVRGAGIVNHPSDNEEFDAAGERLVKTAVIFRSDRASRQGERAPGDNRADRDCTGCHRR